jgi:UDP-2,3-diacylglucosamine hydrolase
MKETLASHKKIYFASDFHLGSPNPQKSRQRELLIIEWLDKISEDAAHIFLVGDVFDFWFEYNKVIPKGFVRFQGKIAELTDRGIKVHFFTGNHDHWFINYFQQELGVSVFENPISAEFNGKKFHIGHGDGLGPGDTGYKIMKFTLFRNPFFRWLFNNILPANLGVWLGQTWSEKNKDGRIDKKEKFETPEKEFLFHYCTDIESKQHNDFYIFGHRHLALDLPIGNSSRYFNLGEWFYYRTYGVFDGDKFELLRYKPLNDDKHDIIRH